MIAAALSLLLSCARAQDVSSIELTPATTQPVLAEPLELTVTARVPSDYVLRLDTASQDTAPFEILGLEKKSSEAAGGRKVESWLLSIVPLAVGNTSFPMLEWSLSGQGDRTLKSPPVPLTVVPPASVKDHPDILELRLALGRAAGPARWFLLALLAAALLAFLAWLMIRRKDASASPDGRRGPPLTPEEEAQKALTELLAEKLFERGETRAFYDRLSGIVRKYLEDRHGIAAEYMTTYDITRWLKKGPLERGGATAARELLESCDLAKFAKFRPTAEEKERDVARARRVFTPPAPAAAAQALAQKGRAA